MWNIYNLKHKMLLRNVLTKPEILYPNYQVFCECQWTALLNVSYLNISSDQASLMSKIFTCEQRADF